MTSVRGRFHWFEVAPKSAAIRSSLAMTNIENVTSTTFIAKSALMKEPEILKFLRDNALTVPEFHILHTIHYGPHPAERLVRLTASESENWHGRLPAFPSECEEAMASPLFKDLLQVIDDSAITRIEADLFARPAHVLLPLPQRGEIDFTQEGGELWRRFEKTTPSTNLPTDRSPHPLPALLTQINKGWHPKPSAVRSKPRIAAGATPDDDWGSEDEPNDGADQSSTGNLDFTLALVKMELVHVGVFGRNDGVPRPDFKNLHQPEILGLGPQLHILPHTTVRPEIDLRPPLSQHLDHLAMERFCQ